jgi:valyl-tRNA synthetase
VPHEGATIALAPYPDPDPAQLDDEAETDLAILMEVVSRIRNLRAELNIDPARRLTVLYRAGEGRTGRLLQDNHATVMTLARLETLRAAGDLDAGGPAARAVARGIDRAVPLAGILDLETERRRLARDIDKLTKEREGHARKLANADFLAKAQPEVVAKARRICQELDERIERLHRTVAALTE